MASIAERTGQGDEESLHIDQQKVRIPSVVLWLFAWYVGERKGRVKKEGRRRIKIECRKK